MSRSEIAERLVVAKQLEAGMNPTEILVAYYDGMSRHHRVAGRTRLAAEYREARDSVAFVKPQFFIDIANALKTSLADVIHLFKDRGIVRLFDKVGWSFKGLWEALKGGYKAYVMVQRVIAEYVAETRGMKKTKEWLEGLDKYLSEHPTTRRLSGIAVGSMLVFLWSTMADTGDANFDFDISEIVAALSGSYSLAKIFGGPDGARLLASIAVGAASNLSFWWPAANTVTFIGGMIRILADKVRKKLSPAREPVEQQAEALGIA